mmetsp:Transcript_35140/g.74962  ORF Transcript_35140/g.74962 Transcript_35140/m.74962 type:complete len:188 (+) Transcript_35140:1645-2208(+)
MFATATITFRQETNLALITQPTWYEWAKDPKFANQFHQKIKESKKQMAVLAASIDKSVAFCLWYYYHRYKPSRNYQILKKLMNQIKEQENSDECAACEEGGELICCETCTDSVSETSRNLVAIIIPSLMFQMIVQMIKVSLGLFRLGTFRCKRCGFMELPSLCTKTKIAAQPAQIPQKTPKRRFFSR